MGLIDQIIGVESGGNPNATNPNSSAMGAGQFINSTWLDTIKAARPDLVQGKSDTDLLALRSDPQLSREMTEAYAAKNGEFLSKNGVPVTPGNTYLAHFAGPQGAVNVLKADPTAPVSSVLSPDAMKANPFLANMTVGDLQAWSARKMGGGAPQPQPAQASPAATPGAPLQLAPQAPVFPAPMPQAAPQAQPQQAPQAALQQSPAQMQAPPIFFAPRRSPDLSKLRAALQAPTFRRG